MKTFTKVLGTFSLLLATVIPALAQEDFAPAGAVWHHNMSAGVFRSTVKNDTTIKGISCRKITQEALTDAASSTGGYKVHNLRDIYVFSTKDTVFIFNELLNDFSPLYIFNVVAGDIVRLPLLNSSNPCAASPGPGFSFDFIIDSVKNITYGSTALKTVYSHNITKDHIGWHGDRDNIMCMQKKSAACLAACSQIVPAVQ